jgi:hypothetical protein
MATAEIPLRYAGGGAAPAAWAANAAGVPYLTFDDTTVEQARYQGVVPANYASGLTLTIYYSMASATTGKVDFEASVMAVTADDAADVDTDSFDTVNAANETVPGTAGYMSALEIPLTNADGVAAGDLIIIKLERDADDATDDTATGDAEVRAVVLSYTTS